MKSYSVKMSDGGRYDFEAEELNFTSGDDWLVVKGRNKIVWLNAWHIISITIKGDGDEDG